MLIPKQILINATQFKIFLRDKIIFGFNSMNSREKYTCNNSSNYEVDEKLLEVISIIFNEVSVNKRIIRYACSCRFYIFIINRSYKFQNKGSHVLTRVIKLTLSGLNLVLESEIKTVWSGQISDSQEQNLDRNLSV